MQKKNQIWKIYGTDYADMTRRLLEGAELDQLIREKAVCLGTAPEEMRIGIKPNLVTCAPAEYGGTTHPEVVEGIVRYLQDAGFRKLLILEGSWVGDKTSDAFEYCGYNALSSSTGVPLLDTQKDRFHAADCGDGMSFSVVDAVNTLDFLINVPVMKGHCQTRVTCALKNLKGLITNAEKRRFHRLGLHKPIAYLQKAIPQDFIVVDHICGDLDFEEGGNPVTRNCVMTALDPVLTDSYVCYLMHYTPDDVPYIRMAEKLGIGTADLSTAEIINLNHPESARRSAASSASGFSAGSVPGSSPSGFFAVSSSDRRKLPQGATIGMDEELPLERRILDVAYAVDAVDSCSACYGMLVSALYRLQKEGLLSRLRTPIGIGQGMQGKPGRLGIGKCTKDFDVCIMGCPPEEETIYTGLKQYILEQEKGG